MFMEKGIVLRQDYTVSKICGNNGKQWDKSDIRVKSVFYILYLAIEGVKKIKKNTIKTNLGQVS